MSYFFKKTDLLFFDVAELTYQKFISLLDSPKPEFLKNEFRLNNKVIIRSKTNKELLAD